MYILLGEDDFFLPTEHSWNMMKRIWPLIVRVIDSKKLNIKELANKIVLKIIKHFHTPPLIEYINETSINASVNLWSPIKSSEIETDNQFNRDNIESYNNLMESLNSLLNDEKLFVFYLFY